MDCLAYICINPKGEATSDMIWKLGNWDWQGVASRMGAEEIIRVLRRRRRLSPTSTPYLDDIVKAASRLGYEESLVRYQILVYAERHDFCHSGIKAMIESGWFQDLGERIIEDLGTFTPRLPCFFLYHVATLSMAYFRRDSRQWDPPRFPRPGFRPLRLRPFVAGGDDDDDKENDNRGPRAADEEEEEEEAEEEEEEEGEKEEEDDVHKASLFGSRSLAVRAVLPSSYGDAGGGGSENSFGAFDRGRGCFCVWVTFGLRQRQRGRQHGEDRED